MHFQLLETENLLLRKIAPEVYHFLFNSQSDEEIKSFLGLETDEQFAKEKDKFSKGMATYNRSFVNFQIIDKKTSLIIGACGFHTWYFEHNRAEIGYNLNSDDFKGKGIMSEAIKKVIQYGFEEMKLHRIEALISPNNEPSLRLVQKLGFVKEGHLRQHYFKNNVMEDSLFLPC
ncbi:GNAT family protein [Flavobacterium sp.]|uniref:GNAT family N-acetyltransferase n=1 Tax=Flavobacterium sp. TaxID=239 RepID=UPI0028BD9C9F|nr:GNAT family protein [Flavobacterium sp.]